MLVTFKSLGRIQRVWQVRFDLGNDEANELAALRHAHNNNAEILPN